MIDHVGFVNKDYVDETAEKVLPAVATADNGKVLTVAAGAWTKAALPSLYNHHIVLVKEDTVNEITETVTFDIITHEATAFTSANIVAKMGNKVYACHYLYSAPSGDTYGSAVTVISDAIKVFVVNVAATPISASWNSLIEGDPTITDTVTTI